MNKEMAIQLLTSANVYLTEEGKKLLEKVVSADGKDVETNFKM